MATAIAGGVGGAAILALYFAPSLYIAMRRRDARRARVTAPAQRARPAAVPPGAAADAA
jgi:hypothetical protein